MQFVTEIELELLTDLSIYQFYEKGKRGGVSVQNSRYAVAGQLGRLAHQTEEQYQESLEYALKQIYSTGRVPNKDNLRVPIEYFDANNLYGHSMCFPLPYKGFRWMTRKELDNWVKTLADNVTLEVDLHTPRHLHDEWNDYPIPEKLSIAEDMLSPFSKECLEGNFIGGEKLCGTLRNKTKYVVSGRLLKYYLSKGHILKKIHRGVTFEEKPWLKPYIELNSKKRAATTVDFERNIFKLMNNAVFGKTMENVRKYLNFKLIKTTKEDTSAFDKLTVRPFFKGTAGRYGDYLTGAYLYPRTCTLNKPIYVGMNVLDYSKLRMNELWYDVLRKQFGERVELLMTDTDSLVVRITSDDINAELMAIEKDLDFTGYPKGHALYREEPNKKIGMLKNEHPADRIVKYCGLRAKLYWFELESGKQEMKAKGIGKTTTKNQLGGSVFEDTLLKGTTLSVDFYEFRTVNHEMRLKNTTKKALSRYDDKRWHLPPDENNNFRSLAYGHYATLP